MLTVTEKKVDPTPDVIPYQQLKIGELFLWNRDDDSDPKMLITAMYGEPHGRKTLNLKDGLTYSPADADRSETTYVRRITSELTFSRRTV